MTMKNIILLTFFLSGFGAFAQETPRMAASANENKTENKVEEPAPVLAPTGINPNAPGQKQVPAQTETPVLAPTGENRGKTNTPQGPR
jgi:hypothetical protein